MKSKNPIINSVIKKPVCNGIGDCFADATFILEKAHSQTDKGKPSKSLLSEARSTITQVTQYDYADNRNKADQKKCLAAIDKAISSPTLDNIMAARWECEKARAYADGGSPRRAFWNSKRIAKNAKFKVGDKVTDGTAVFKITGVDNDWGSYEWTVVSGRADPKYSKGGDFGWAEQKMRIANARKEMGLNSCAVRIVKNSRRADIAATLINTQNKLVGILNLKNRGIIEGLDADDKAAFSCVDEAYKLIAKAIAFWH